MQDMQEMQMQDMQGHHLSDVSEANIEADAVKQLDNELLIFAPFLRACRHMDRTVTSSSFPNVDATKPIRP
jgi:hypothetical protein